MAGVLYAHAQLHNAAHATSLPVYLQRPYYSHYPSQINATTVMGADSTPSLGMAFDPIPSYHRDINPNGIEVVTYPNNPSTHLSLINPSMHLSCPPTTTVRI